MTRTPWAEYERAVRVYTEAGAAETVQRIVTAISRLSRRLDVFYRDRYEALDIVPHEWPVLHALALEGRNGVSNPSRLAAAAGVPASTMTHRLDRMVARGLIKRAPDPENRTRMAVSLTQAGWELFRAAVARCSSDRCDRTAGAAEERRSDGVPTALTNEWFRPHTGQRAE